MKKHVGNYIWIVLFLLLSLLPSLGMLIWGESAPAARELSAPRPRLQSADGSFNSQVLNDTADYLGSRFALRQQMVTAWARLNAALFHTSVEEQVLLGQDGWLYYTPSLPDYVGEGADEETLDAIAARLRTIQDEAEARGAKFYFTVAPNKNSLYGEHMPAWAENRHEDATIVRLRPYLEKHGVHYINLFSLPMPYYRTDSHWTAEGAALAADSLLSAMGRHTAYGADRFVSWGTHLGDLYEMLYPASSGGEDAIVDESPLGYETLSDPRGGDAITIQTENPEGQGKLLCWRDSFGAALYPYLADSFSEALFSRNADYDLEQIWDQDYDVVLLEIVERNLETLANGGNET